VKIRWQPIVKIKTALLFQWYIFEGNKEKYFKSSLNLDFGLTNEKIISDEIFIDLNEWAKLEELLTSKAKMQREFLKKFTNLCYRHSDDLIKTAKQINRVKNWQRVKNNQLLSLYRKYQNSVLSLIPFLDTILVLDNVLKKEITNLLESKLSIKDKKEQDLLLSKLIIPKKKSFFIKEQEALLKIALKLQKDRKTDIRQDIKDYLKNYAWMGSLAYLGSFFTKKEAVKKIKEFLEEGPKEKLVKTKQIKRETLENYRKAFNQIKQFPKLVDLIKIAQEFIYLQTYRMDVLFLAHWYAYSLWEKIGEHSGLTVDELVYLTGDEIINLLKRKRGVNRREIKARLDNFALIKQNNRYTFLSGGKVRKVIQKVVRETVVKGAVANRGRATGKAKLLFGEKDMEKVNRGDIVVSPMTYPKFVPALAKASGIITDFGGILCHAAIVSREFGVPCIVGTENATKVFKDGDLVELNAYDGVARKV